MLRRIHDQDSQVEVELDLSRFCTTMQSPSTARGAFGLYRPRLLSRIDRPLVQRSSDRRLAGLSNSKQFRDNIRSKICAGSDNSRQGSILTSSTQYTLALWLLSEFPAQAADTADFSKGGFAKESYYVTLGLFLLSLPGKHFRFVVLLWQISSGLCHCPTLRKTYEFLAHEWVVPQGCGLRSKGHLRQRK